MVANGYLKKQCKNTNDPARFVNKVAVTNEGEKTKIHYYLDMDKIAEEEIYDGLYAVCTDLLDDNVEDILKVSEGRWQIEDCFRTMKTDFKARQVFLNREDRIKAHFLTCFLALLPFRLLKSITSTHSQPLCGMPDLFHSPIKPSYSSSITIPCSRSQFKRLIKNFFLSELRTEKLRCIPGSTSLSFISFANPISSK